MSEEASGRVLQSAERLKFFTDAVVAIALTLLVLPLLESVPETAARGQTTARWLTEHHDQMLGLLVSFIVVSSYWRRHHRLFEHVAGYTPRLVALSFGWMLAVVFLQVPSALVYVLPTDRLLVALYVGTMAIGSAMLTALAWTVHSTPTCQVPDSPLDREEVLRSLVVTTLYVVALVVGVAFPPINFFALLVLALNGPVQRLVIGRTGHRSLR